MHLPSSTRRRLRPLGRLLAAYTGPLVALARLLATPARRLVRRTDELADSRRRLLAGPLAVVGLGVVAFSLFAGLSGGVSTAANATVSSNPQVVAAGEQLYDLHCSSCHGVNGVGSSRAPSLVEEGAAGADFYLSTGRMPLNNPHDEAIQHHPYFNEGQIEQLDSYIAALPGINGQKATGPGIPTVDPLCTSPNADDDGAITAAENAGTSNCVTLTFGSQTYALNCAQCHQIAGRGGLLSKANVIPSLQNASLIEAAEAVRIGPKPMPVFGAGQLTQDQLSAVSHYVEYLHNPTHPGGLTISGFGPTAEGFVGIVVGLGLLLFVSRLIGTRG